MEAGSERLTNTRSEKGNEEITRLERRNMHMSYYLVFNSSIILYMHILNFGHFHPWNYSISLAFLLNLLFPNKPPFYFNGFL